MVERIYLGPKASVEAMLRGALGEFVRWLACAPRLDLHAVDLTDPVLHPAALLFHTSLALEGVGPLLEVVEQLLERALGGHELEPLADPLARIEAPTTSPIFSRSTETLPLSSVKIVSTSWLSTP